LNGNQIGIKKYSEVRHGKRTIPMKLYGKDIIDGLIRKGHSDMCHDMISILEFRTDEMLTK
jgi:hypothetical protein